ncbi:MAG: response regulator transcription factor [Elusimicrobia bacterium]|nr:response regulator transcription factor [Elusimicrobiota bacterium]
MLVISRDARWLGRLQALAERGSWPFEARAALPGLAGSERALAVLDRGLAGALPAKAIAALRALYPGAAVALALDDGDMSPDAMTLALGCGADEVLGKSWPNEKLSKRLADLRDRSLSLQSRVSADGTLKAERRAHRALVRARGRWSEVILDAGSFAMLWLLMERDGQPVSRAHLSGALSAAVGRELEAGTLMRRMAGLKKALSSWRGRIVSVRGGLYRLVPAPVRKV